jgi:hypothetical protein
LASIREEMFSEEKACNDKPYESPFRTGGCRTLPAR